MSSNDLTEKEQCDRFCTPTNGGGYSYDSEGDVFRCEHGVVRRCWRNTGWAYWSDRRRDWSRIGPWLYPIRYRRAVAAIEQEADQ